MGSGYGASIAALRAAQFGLSVCVLEKGKERQPGEYPESNAELRRDCAVEHYSLGRLSGDVRGGALYDVSLGRDMSVLSGSGLGGGSQVNASVSLAADPRVWADPRWPMQIREDHASGQLDQDWKQAEAMLKPAALPKHFLPVKSAAMRKAAEDMLARAAAEAAAKAEVDPAQQPPANPLPDIEEIHIRPPLFVNYHATADNGFGVPQGACTGCGNCTTGCNVGAKNSLIMNYLPAAVRLGCSIFVQMTVIRVEAISPGMREANKGTAYERCNWRVHVRYAQCDWEPFGERHDVLFAEFVFLGAGCMGTTKLLLQSARADQTTDAATPLTLSATVGQRFSANGDFISFAAKTEHRSRIVGYDADELKQPQNACNLNIGDPTPGPTISTMIDARRLAPDLQSAFVIEDGTGPGSMALATRIMLAVTQGVLKGALEHSAAMLTMAHDSASGALMLSPKHPSMLVCEWPGAGREAWIKPVLAANKSVAASMGGQFVPSWMHSDRFNNRLITTHPLGGAVLGEDAERGVCNHAGQVFSAAHGTATHETLFVVDAALIPLSLGINPVRTICTLAERIMRQCATRFEWAERRDALLRMSPSLSESPDEMRSLSASLEYITVNFRERMNGFSSTDPADIDWLRTRQWRSEAWRQFKCTALARPALKKAQSDVKHPAHAEFVLSISMEDVQEFLQRHPHKAFVHAGGQVLLNQISPVPFRVEQGRFTLFNDSPSEIDTKEMIYALDLTHPSAPGRRWLLTAKKFVVARGHGPNLAAQSCTCYVRLYQDASIRDHDDSRIVLIGVLFISVANFIRQVRTLQFIAPTVQRRLGTARWKARCIKITMQICRLFQQAIFDAYFAWLNPFVPGLEQNLPQFIKRVKRPLSVVPKHFLFQTADGTELMLTRYRLRSSPGGSPAAVGTDSSPLSSSSSGSPSPGVSPAAAGLRGPLLFVHGMNSCGQMWVHDTTTVSWVEYMASLNYDCWTFDWRSSNLLRTAKDYTMDDVAKYDHPAAIEYLCRLTGHADVIVFALCVGSGTLMQSLLAGYVNPKRIRALVAHQVALHCVVPIITRIKSATGLTRVLHKLKVTVSMQNSETLTDRLFAKLAGVSCAATSHVYCNVDACRRMGFVFGQIVDHARVSPAAHEAMHEFVGLATPRPFMHLQKWLKHERLVPDQGDTDFYLPKCPEAAKRKVAEKLAGIPILCVDSGNSQVWRLETMQRSYDLLRAALPEQDVRYITFEGRGHLDLLMGIAVHEEVFPFIAPFIHDYAQSAPDALHSGSPDVQGSPASPTEGAAWPVEFPLPLEGEGADPVWAAGADQPLELSTSPISSSLPPQSSSCAPPSASSAAGGGLHVVNELCWRVSRSPESLSHHLHPLPNFGGSVSLRSQVINRFTMDLHETVVAINMEAIPQARRSIVTFSDTHLACDWTTDSLSAARLAPLIAHVHDLASRDALLGIVLLGDIFEMWVTPCNQVPLSADEMVDRWHQLPVFDAFRGMLQWCVEKRVRVWFLRGNHDDEMSESLLHRFLPLEVEFVPGVLVLRCCYPTAAATTEREYTVRFEHGHSCDLLNVRVPSMLLHGRPLGYYVSRLAATYRVLHCPNELRSFFTNLAYKLPWLAKPLTMSLCETTWTQKKLIKLICKSSTGHQCKHIENMQIAMEESTQPEKQLSQIEARTVSVTEIIEFPLLERLRQALLSSGLSTEAATHRIWFMCRATMDGGSKFLVQHWMHAEDELVDAVSSGKTQRASVKRMHCDVFVTGHTHEAQLQTVSSPRRRSRSLLYCNTGGWTDRVLPTFLTMQMPDPQKRSDGRLTIHSTAKCTFPKK